MNRLLDTATVLCVFSVAALIGRGACAQSRFSHLDDFNQLSGALASSPAPWDPTPKTSGGTLCRITAVEHKVAGLKSRMRLSGRGITYPLIAHHAVGDHATVYFAELPKGAYELRIDNPDRKNSLVVPLHNLPGRACELALIEGAQPEITAFPLYVRRAVGGRVHAGDLRRSLAAQSAIRCVVQENIGEADPYQDAMASLMSSYAPTARLPSDFKDDPAIAFFQLIQALYHSADGPESLVTDRELIREFLSRFPELPDGYVLLAATYSVGTEKSKVVELWEKALSLGLPIGAMSWDSLLTLAHQLGQELGQKKKAEHGLSTDYQGRGGVWATFTLLR